MKTLNWKYLSFNELSVQELYAILQLRAAVFVVEQDCAYNDLDGKDEKSWHLLGYDEENDLVAYSRILPVGLSYKTESSIGRIISSAKIRGTGMGKVLVERSIEALQSSFGKVPIRIGAQCYAIKFYENCKFEISGEEYDEDGIPHVEMVYTKTKNNVDNF